MFENLKAFMMGWRTKGKYPGLSPEIARPYTDAVMTYFEDDTKRALLRMSVCDRNEETLPFDFSYEALPLSMAEVMAHTKSSGRDDYERYVVEVLRNLTGPLGRERPAYEVSMILRDQDEIARMHQLYRVTGAVCSISTFAQTQFSWGGLLDAVFPVRSLPIMESMTEILGGGGNHKGNTLKFGSACAQQFLRNSTAFPTKDKAARMAEHIIRYFFVLSDIPSYQE